MTDSGPSFPRLLRVQQDWEGPQCTNIKNRVFEELERARVADKLRAGDSVAITAGSRGITNIAKIIQAIAAFFLERQTKPFIVPAMGSHGGGTAEGQRRVIESYGITEEFCGCPIRSSMNTVVIGEAAEGFPVFFDEHAYHADHVVVCGRIKPHTNFSGDIQSGLMKMMMIGLGKKDGAALYHRAIYEHGFPQIIRSVAPQVVANANILIGMAIVENAVDETAHLEALHPHEFQSRETELLAMAKQLMPKLPFRDIDLLLVDRIGKNVSGTGMDTNVIGRKLTEKTPDQPNVRRIIVRNLTAETYGNATGVGFAEFCLTRVVEQMDREATVLNCVTALDVDGAKIPVHYQTDREALQVAMGMLGMKQPQDVRLVWILDTGHLSTLACSESLLPDIEASAFLRPLSSPEPMPLGSDGMLPDDFFVH